MCVYICVILYVCIIYVCVILYMCIYVVECCICVCVFAACFVGSSLIRIVTK